SLWIDMEESTHTELTLEMCRTLAAAGLSNVRVALQAYLFRTEEDLRSLIELGVGVRLVKGAYLEPASVAFPRKADVDENFAHLAEMSLLNGSYTAIATHDQALLDRALDFAGTAGTARERVEVQMMLGIREEAQERLASDGYRVRVVVSYGEDWYGFFMRRLAERPANVAFFLRNLRPS